MLKKDLTMILRSEKYAQENGRAVTELESMLASKEKIDAFRKIVIDSMAEFWNEKEYLKFCPDGKIKEYSEDELKEFETIYIKG